MRSPILIVLALLACQAQAAGIVLTHPYGELIDRGVVTAQFSASSPYAIDCAVASPTVRRTGSTITITTHAFIPSAPSRCPPMQASLGELSAGWWTVVLRVLDMQDGVIEELKTEWRVTPPDSLCNRYPDMASVFVIPSPLAIDFANRIASDTAYATLFGNPTGVTPDNWTLGAWLSYPPLENPPDIVARLLATGAVSHASPTGLGCFATPPPDAYGAAVEYYHAGLDQYFMTAYASEIQALDSGAGPHGWTRTGKSFRVLMQPGCLLYRAEGVAYRFFGRPGVGPSSHVFTIDRAECRIVDKSGAWIYEGIAFWATPATSSGGCSNAHERPLYRLWRPFGVSNHRFTIERAVVDEMKAKGWVEEGAVMCVLR